jgi:hypothetical protein
MQPGIHPGFSPARDLSAVRLNLRCGDLSPLSDWQTCLPVPKRSHACALQIRALPEFLEKEVRGIIGRGRFGMGHE